MKINLLNQINNFEWRAIMADINKILGQLMGSGAAGGFAGGLAGGLASNLLTSNKGR